MVEIAHEALLNHWPTLSAWLDEQSASLRTLRQLRFAASVWEQHGRSNDYLWIGDQLANARQMVSDLQPMLSELERDFLKPEQERLLDEIARPDTAHYRRAVIGERLNVIGDTRAGVNVRADGLPDIAWVEIPGGTVTLPAGKSSVGPQDRTFDLAPFKISKYAITYGQFAAFADAEDGYIDKTWWAGIGSHRQPRVSPRMFDNHPVEYASWYDAVAFCRWVSEKLGITIRLPTEAEWMRAATSANPSNLYPWGGRQYFATHANTRDSELLRTTAVGMYPQGATAHGVHDMVGNVWEWCQNELEIPAKNEYTGAGVKRSLKGCSNQSRSHKATLDYRAGNVPNRRNEAHGFRVVCEIEA